MREKSMRLAGKVALITGAAAGIAGELTGFGGAAARLFALKGYHDTKLEEIRTAAEVTTGAFFHHFQSKEGLLGAAS